MGIRLSLASSALPVQAKTLTASRGKTATAAVTLYNKGSGSAGSAAAISFTFAEIPGFVIVRAGEMGLLTRLLR
jgi:hypothetical protein